MSETENPFRQPETPSPGPIHNPWLAWGAAAVMAMLAILFIMFWTSARNQQQRALQAVQTQLDQARSQLADALAENQTNQDSIAALKGQVADLEKERDTAAQMSKALEDEMRSQLQSQDVTISNLQGRLTVSIVDRVMFDSGEAILKPDGQAVMQKIASILREHPQLKIQVIGHTDNVPIRPTAHARFASNWELSTARALAAVHFLTEQAGVDPRRVGAVGYGEFRPVADNSTPEGRARNRRIAISIVPDQLAGVEAPPAARSKEDTNSIPAALPGDVGASARQ